MLKHGLAVAAWQRLAIVAVYVKHCPTTLQCFTEGDESSVPAYPLLLTSKELQARSRTWAEGDLARSDIAEHIGGGGISPLCLVVTFCRSERLAVRRINLGNVYDFNQGNRDPAVVKRQVQWAHDQGLQSTVECWVYCGAAYVSLGLRAWECWGMFGSWYLSLQKHPESRSQKPRDVLNSELFDRIRTRSRACHMGRTPETHGLFPSPVSRSLWVLP